MSQENNPRHITVSEMAPHIHTFAPNENKAAKISAWLIDWIKISIKTGKIKKYDYLPLKGELAFHIGVSIGTMQNVFRMVEDAGYIESKQRVGAYITADKNERAIEKLTSKREIACERIKKYILVENYSKGDRLVSVRKLATITGIPYATVLNALNMLVLQKILGKRNNSFFVANTVFEVKQLESRSLVEKVAYRIKKYIEQNCKYGDNLPSNNRLAEQYQVSVKTIHDAIKLLVKEGLLKTRRGRYGTSVYNSEDESDLYIYEKIEQKIRKYIATHCQIGSKLPTIRSFVDEYNVSSKTVKKALDDLAEDGYLTFARGRYGGTFVTDIPTDSNEAYTWLALNPEFMDKN